MDVLGKKKTILVEQLLLWFFEMEDIQLFVKIFLANKANWQFSIVFVWIGESPAEETAKGTPNNIIFTPEKA